MKNRMSNIFVNDKGIALVLVSLLALIGLAIVAALLFMVTQSTRMSGYHRVFRTVEDAGLGGTSIGAEFIRNNIPNATNNDALVMPFSDVSPTGNNACLVQKLTANTANWTSCSSDEKSLDPTTNWDMQYTLPNSDSTINYNVYTKIVDTVTGNTEVGGLAPGVLRGTGVVDSQGRISPAANPSLFRVEVQAQNAANPKEVSRYSVLYAY